MNSRKPAGVFLIILLSLVFSTSVAAQSINRDSNYKGTPPPMVPDVTGLDEYNKRLVYADTNLQAGDYEGALEALKEAERIRKDDPFLYEMYGIVYKANRDPDKAFLSFKKAGYMYLEKKNFKKAFEMLSWMKTIKYDSKEVTDFEKKLRKRQEVIKHDIPHK